MNRLRSISSKIVCTSVYLDLDLAFPDLVTILIDILYKQLNMRFTKTMLCATCVAPSGMNRQWRMNLFTPTYDPYISISSSCKLQEFGPCSVSEVIPSHPTP